MLGRRAELGGETPREVHRASDCKTLASRPAHAVHRLIWPAAVQTACFTTQASIPQRRATASVPTHSANLQPQKATAGVEHPTLRVAALITAIGTKNTEPPGAGDTTETSLPPSEQSISRDDATAARGPLTTQHTQARARAANSFIPKRGPVTTPQMTSPNIYACGTHLLALAEDRHDYTQDNKPKYTSQC